ncbi:uncharacterized [Tachysurus ichikawai]
MSEDASWILKSTAATLLSEVNLGKDQNVAFYHGSIKSILTYCISTWYTETRPAASHQKCSENLPNLELSPALQNNEVTAMRMSERAPAYKQEIFLCQDTDSSEVIIYLQ